jgi:hypothetical protein
MYLELSDSEVYWHIEKLDWLISRVKGHCMDCHTPCKKAHPSHTGTCDCCDYIAHMEDSCR